ncbi:MAG: tetratricopeptide repeat protein [Verrucomicrobiota bacterium]
MAALQSQKRPAGRNGNGAVFGVCVLLVVAVWLVFGQTMRYGFVNCDDGPYVYENTQVVKGLTLAGIVWAFTHSHASNWHPLTWISHMLDCQLYGLNAGGHHLTNVLLHMATAILLFLALRQMMRLRSEASSPQAGLRSDKSIGDTAIQADTLWPCAFVAAVFAIHPLRVESVAWVAERKDVLSGLFFMLTLLMYARYVQNCAKSQVSGVRWLRSCDYWIVVLFFALGLMSKPMLVTLPFVLLLLDYWPLNRFESSTVNSDESRAGSQLSTSRILRLVFEKLPMFLPAIAASFIAFLTQKSDGTVATIDCIPLGLRLANGLVSYVTYVLKMFWPENLAVFYPYPAMVPTWEIAVAGTLLLFGTLLAVVFARRRPYLLVGWLWYLGMSVPVIGLVQVGPQSHADRYTYLPQIGLYLLVVWAIRDVVAFCGWRRQVLSAGASIVVVFLMLCAWRQTTYWRNAESLWRHTLACTSGNYFAHNNLGTVLLEKDQIDEAISQYQEAIRLTPDYAEAHYNLGTAFLKKDQFDEAIDQFQEAIRLKPDYADAHFNLGTALGRKGQMDEAISQFQEAIRLTPDYADAHNSLGIALAMRGQMDEAISQYREAIRLTPDYADAHFNLGVALGMKGQTDEAISQFQEAVRLRPDDIEARQNLARALEKKKVPAGR